jgi:hypothetical protein
MSYKSFIRTKPLLLLMAIAAAFTSCLKEPDFTNNPTNPDTSHAKIEITDGPIDNPNVRGVYITVVDIKINGESWKGFSGKSTFDLLALQHGETKLLGDGELEAGTFDNIELVLDTETDADGGSPGSYIKDAQGVKRALGGANEMTIKVKGVMSTTVGQTTESVIDFDLRRAIVYESGSNTDFEFVTETELENAVRLVEKNTTGNITGHVTDGVSNSDKVIVYAYDKGDFEIDEKFPQGPSQIMFKNAITSAVVNADGDFNLAFLESGNYELHFISYQEDDANQLRAHGELQMNVLGSVTVDLLGIKVNASDTVDVDLKVTGLQFF